MKYVRSYKNYAHIYHPKYEERNFPLIGIIVFEEKDHKPVLSYSVKEKIQQETQNVAQLIQELKRRRNINSSSGYNDIRSAELTRRNGLGSTFINENGQDTNSFSACASPYVISRINYESIAKGEYRGASGMTNVYFPYNSRLKRIDTYAFMNTDIENISFPDSLEVIRKKAFMNSHVKSIRIPDNVTRIGKMAFYNCQELENLNLGGGDFDFEDDEGRIIHDKAFARCFSLTSLVIPPSVGQIRKGAFAACRNLEYVYIGANVKHLGLGVFQACSNLNRIVVDPENPYFFVDKNGILCRRGKKEGKNVYVSFIPINKTKLDLCYNNGNSGIIFGHRVFNGMEIDTLKVTSNNYVHFKKGAFGPVSVGLGGIHGFRSKRRKSSIRELIIDGYPTHIDFRAGSFAESGIEHIRVTIPDGGTLSIDQNAFKDCDNLELIEIVCEDHGFFWDYYDYFVNGGVDDSITEIRWEFGYSGYVGD